MRNLPLVCCALVLSGCMYQLPMHAPDTLILPDTVGHGGHFSVRLWGAEIADYRFMGAVRQADGTWEVRIDPVWLGLFSQESKITVREGDALPLGSQPSVLVEFVSIAPTELKLRAIKPHTPGSDFVGN